MTGARAMQRVLAALSWIGVAVAGGCGEPSGPQTGTETNWLAACSLDTDCSVGSCVCSVCTLPCEADTDCPESPGPNACARGAGGPVLLCQSERPPGLCLSTCSERADCADGLDCVNGSCIPDGMVASQSSSGGAGSSAGGGGGAPELGRGGAEPVAPGGGVGEAPGSGGTVAETGGAPATSGGSDSAGSAGQTAAVSCSGLVGPGRPYPTIQQAIDSEADGAIIEICAGSYAETLLLDHDVTLVGVEGRDATFVDAGGVASVVLVLESVNATLRGLTLRGGVGSHDNGVNDDMGGGGIINLGTLTLSEAMVAGNDANYGAGVLNLGSLTLESSRVEDNHAVGVGGGIVNGYPYSSISPPAFLVIRDSEIRANTAQIGGGIYDNGEQPLELADSVLSGNTAAFGGGFYTYFGKLTFDRVRFQDNHATNFDVTSGGGLYMEATAFTFTDVEFSDNSAAEAGAIFAVGSTGSLTRGAILRNHATGTSPPLGAGIRFDSESLDCDGVDFGAGADDNVPAADELTVWDLSYAFGPATSVHCSVSGCE